jgi:hypothetical protein
MVLTLVSTGRRCRKAEGASDAGASFSSVWYRTDASRPFEKRNFFETKSEPNERFRRQILAGNYLPTERSGQDNGNESRDFDFSHLRARLRCFRGRTGRCAVLIGAAAACGGDAQRLCASSMANPSQLPACMQSNASRVSARCRAAMGGGKKKTKG